MRRAIHAQLSSPHISVREAAVNLVGMYTSHTNKFDVYLDPLLQRLGDNGVSVRRRVVKILAGGMHLLDGKDRAMACNHLLTCASNPKEEDSVQDLIHNLFIKLWFEIYQAQSEVTPKISSRKEYYAKISEQMLNVIYHSLTTIVGTNSNINENLTIEYIKDITRQLTTGYSRDGDANNEIQHRSKRRAEMEQHCRHLVEAFLEHLLSFEETKTLFQEKPESYVSSAHILVLIDTLSCACPELIDMEVIQLLLPYLKPDIENNKPATAQMLTRHSSLITSTTLGIITRTLPFLSKSQVENISSILVDDSVKICYTGLGENIVAKATEVLCCLERYNRKSDVREKVLKLCGEFYWYSSCVHLSLTFFF